MYMPGDFLPKISTFLLFRDNKVAKPAFVIAAHCEFFTTHVLYPHYLFSLKSNECQLVLFGMLM
jgi:hypothetical protein